MPVSSLMTPRSCAEVVAANWLRGFATSASPPPVIVCSVPSSRMNFDPVGVPVARFAIGITPLMFAAGMFVCASVTSELMAKVTVSAPSSPSTTSVPVGVAAG